MSLNKRINDLVFKISTRRYDLSKKLLSEVISYSTAEDYMNKNNNNQTGV